MIRTLPTQALVASLCLVGSATAQNVTRIVIVVRHDPSLVQLQRER